jgi:hypothetical protein
MKLVFLPFLLIALNSHAQTEEVIETRFASVSIGSADGLGSVYKLTINNKVALEYEGGSISVEKVLSIGEYDYLLISKNTGGSACPVEEMFFFELSTKNHVKVSEPFAQCSSGGEAKIINNSPSAIIPIYYPHPEYQSEKELKEAEEYQDTYTYVNNSIQSKREQITKK